MISLTCGIKKKKGKLLEKESRKVVAKGWVHR